MIYKTDLFLYDMWEPLTNYAVPIAPEKSNK